MAITLIDEAVHAGARCHKACEVIGITCRTLRRWRTDDTLEDSRQHPTVRQYPHALTDTGIDHRIRPIMLRQLSRLGCRCVRR